MYSCDCVLLAQMLCVYSHGHHIIYFWFILIGGEQMLYVVCDNTNEFIVPSQLWMWLSKWHVHNYKDVQGNNTSNWTEDRIGEVTSFFRTSGLSQFVAAATDRHSCSLEVTSFCSGLWGETVMMWWQLMTCGNVWCLGSMSHSQLVPLSL